MRKYVMANHELIVRSVFPESQPREFTDVEQRQLVIAQRIKASLQRRNLLATEKESVRKFTEEFHLEQIDASPEFWLSKVEASGLTDFDHEIGMVQVYLMPHFDRLAPALQLVTILEEAIHVHQLKHQPPPNGRYTDIEEATDDVAAKDRILKIAGFLELNENEIQEIKDCQGFHLRDKKELEARGWDNFPDSEDKDMVGISDRFKRYLGETNAARSERLFEEVMQAALEKEAALKAQLFAPGSIEALIKQGRTPFFPNGIQGNGVEAETEGDIDCEIPPEGVQCGDRMVDVVSGIYAAISSGGNLRGFCESLLLTPKEAELLQGKITLVNQGY